MEVFFTAWAVAAVSLGLAVAILSVIYRVLGGDFGTDSPGREAMIVIFTSAVHGGVVTGVLAFHQTPSAHSFKAIYIIAFIATYLIYKFTHLQDMAELELMILTGLNYVIFLALWLTLGIIMGP